MAKHKLTEEEKKEWGDLYEYLKKEIFHYALLLSARPIATANSLATVINACC